MLYMPKRNGQQSGRVELTMFNIAACSNCAVYSESEVDIS